MQMRESPYLNPVFQNAAQQDIATIASFADYPQRLSVHYAIST